MLQGTGIKLKGVTFNNAALPKLSNYKDLIAANASCVGVWRFDLDALVVENAQGGITSIKNWKDGGPSLDLASIATSLATRQVSAALGGKVANFTGPVIYKLQNYVFDPRADHTMVVVFKPNSYAAEVNVLGNRKAADGLRVAVTALPHPTTGLPVIAHYHGQSAPVVPVADVSKFVSFFANYSALTAGARILDTVEVTSNRAEGLPAEVPFALGTDQTNFFAGQVDFVALFNTNLNAASNLELKNNVEQYLRLRTGVA